LNEKIFNNENASGQSTLAAEEIRLSPKKRLSANVMITLAAVSVKAPFRSYLLSGRHYRPDGWAYVIPDDSIYTRDSYTSCPTILKRRAPLFRVPVADGETSGQLNQAVSLRKSFDCSSWVNTGAATAVTSFTDLDRINSARSLLRLLPLRIS